MSFVSIIAVYAPTNPVSSTADVATPSEEFYYLLLSTLSLVPQNDLVIILIRRFRCSYCGDSHSWHSVIGPHSLGERNDNGTRLLDFCANKHLIVSNTWFQHKPIHQATWFQNGDRSRTCHMIDFVLLNSCFRSS